MSTPLDRILALTRHVRTPEGSRAFHLPIGAPIVAHSAGKITRVAHVDPAWGARTTEIQQAAQRPSLTSVFDDMADEYNNPYRGMAPDLVDLLKTLKTPWSASPEMRERILPMFNFSSGKVRAEGTFSTANHRQVFARPLTPIERLNSGYDVLSVSGLLYENKSGPEHVIGSFTRQVFKNTATGKLSAHNVFLSIDDSRFRGNGFATAFNRHTENWYIANHVTSIELQAGLSRGAYVWARAGYDWNKDAEQGYNYRETRPQVAALCSFIYDAIYQYPSEQRKLMMAELQDIEMRNTGANYRTSNFPTPYELTEVGRKVVASWDKAHPRQSLTPGKDTWPGKEGMLGDDRQWDGIKYLVPPVAVKQH